MILSLKLSGTSPFTIRCAKPSAIAVFAYAGFANQYRIVLGAPTDHVDQSTDLFVASDNRIQLALTSVRGQVAPVFSQAFVGRFGILIGDPLATSDGLQRLKNIIVRYAVAPQKGAHVTSMRERQ